MICSVLQSVFCNLLTSVYVKSVLNWMKATIKGLVEYQFVCAVFPILHLGRLQTLTDVTTHRLFQTGVLLLKLCFNESIGHKYTVSKHFTDWMLSCMYKLTDVCMSPLFDHTRMSLTHTHLPPKFCQQLFKSWYNQTRVDPNAAWVYFRVVRQARVTDSKHSIGDKAILRIRNQARWQGWIRRQEQTRLG